MGISKMVELKIEERRELKASRRMTTCSGQRGLEQGTSWGRKTGPRAAKTAACRCADHHCRSADTFHVHAHASQETRDLVHMFDPNPCWDDTQVPPITQVILSIQMRK